LVVGIFHHPDLHGPSGGGREEEWAEPQQWAESQQGHVGFTAALAETFPAPRAHAAALSSCGE